MSTKVETKYRGWKYRGWKSMMMVTKSQMKLQKFSTESWGSLMWRPKLVWRGSLYRRLVIESHIIVTCMPSSWVPDYQYWECIFNWYYRCQLLSIGSLYPNITIMGYAYEHTILKSFVHGDWGYPSQCVHERMSRCASLSIQWWSLSKNEYDVSMSPRIFEMAQECKEPKWSKMASMRGRTPPPIAC